MKRLFSAVLALGALCAFSILFTPTGPAKGQTQAQGEYYDLLILGIDRRPHQKTGRSDVMMIVHCENGRVSLFSCPRDTLTDVRGRKDKMNHAYAYGGVMLTKQTLEQFLDFKVDNYIVLDFETFLQTIDTVKVLTDNGRLIGAENFLVSGENLLKWLRFRSFNKGDRRRAQRHQLFIKRVLEYTQNMYNHENGLFEQCTKAGLKLALTDLTYEHIQGIFNTYKNFNIERDLERYVLPGHYESRYISNPNKRFESVPMPDLSKIDNDPTLTPEQKAKKKREALARWRRSQKPAANFYIPQYKWSLATYIHYYRSKGIKMNYVEEDNLRK